MAYSAFSMLFCAFIFSAKIVIQELRARFAGEIFIWGGVAICVCVIGLVVLTVILRRNKYVSEILLLLGSFRFWRVMIMSVALFAFGASILVAENVILLGQYVSMSFRSTMLLLSANFVAIFVGYITPGVPGGIGVREAVLLAILSPYFPGDAVLLAALTHRIIMILGDVVAAPVSALFITQKAGGEPK
jgi:uncharacterized membrane protein YbhN (UPF0104 family)